MNSGNSSMPGLKPYHASTQTPAIFEQRGGATNGWLLGPRKCVLARAFPIQDDFRLPARAISGKASLLFVAAFADNFYSIILAGDKHCALRGSKFYRRDDGGDAGN
ncbi:hypothetical protein BaRGS_00037761 [Batillaria attramentaria]|uniref:Uncharacterized protein n=1 Tax=Batillaria attramentaria TaxID=370345 RepID=A0ABD0J810_9CAEN